MDMVQDLRQSFGVTIAVSGSLSASGSLVGNCIIGLITPSAWTTADISFDISLDGINFYPLYNQQGEVTIPSTYVSTSQSRFFALDPNDFLGASHIKVRSGINGAAVAQNAAARSFILVCRAI